MALSTFFTDDKVANYVGSLLLNFPIYIFLNIVQWTGAGRNFLYFMNWIPIVPVCSIMARLTRPNPGLVPDTFTTIKTDWIIEPVEWIFLISNIPFWIVIYLYLDNVAPTTYGVRKPYLYFWTGDKVSESEQFSSRFDAESVNENIYNKSDPIKLQKLTKKFGNFKAVDELTLSIKQGEVFTILGHNGAGKTTAINMLTGMLQTTSGTAKIYGYDITKNIDKVQQNLGLCQQFDVLYDKLTVIQHMNLVCEIKNVPRDQVTSLIEETLQVVMLTEHRNKEIRHLSGGMKRKVSLALAIVTKPKLIILDEPTSGLDVESRRQVWELIKRIKVGRSIIMSSQHLEEADELADRICIMTKGQLLALEKPEQIK